MGNRLIRNGRDLSDRVAQRIEKRLETEPDDVESRLLLVGYWGNLTKGISGDWKGSLTRERLASWKERLSRQEPHVIWLIENAPHIDLLGGPFGCDYLPTPRVLDAWRASVAVHPSNGVVLWNATYAFRTQMVGELMDTLRHPTKPASDGAIVDEVIDLFERARVAAPGSLVRFVHDWAKSAVPLGSTWGPQQRFGSAVLRAAFEAFDAERDEKLRTCLLWPLLECARLAGSRDAAIALAEANRQRRLGCQPERLFALVAKARDAAA